MISHNHWFGSSNMTGVSAPVNKTDIYATLTISRQKTNERTLIFLKILEAYEIHNNENKSCRRQNKYFNKPLTFSWFEVENTYQGEGIINSHINT
jgi:hypothetical protein